VRVLQARGELDLELEALRAKSPGQLRMEHLERYGTIVPEVIGEIDNGHATPPELALEGVAVGQGGLEFFHGLDQTGLLDRGISRLLLRPTPGQSNPRRLLPFLLPSLRAEAGYWGGEEGTDAR
jgi:hypothetical protein